MNNSMKKKIQETQNIQLKTNYACLLDFLNNISKQKIEKSRDLIQKLPKKHHQILNKITDIVNNYVYLEKKQKQLIDKQKTILLELYQNREKLIQVNRHLCQNYIDIPQRLKDFQAILQCLKSFNHLKAAKISQKYDQKLVKIAQQLFQYRLLKYRYNLENFAIDQTFYVQETKMRPEKHFKKIDQLLSSKEKAISRFEGQFSNVIKQIISGKKYQLFKDQQLNYHLKILADNYKQIRKIIEDNDKRQKQMFDKMVTAIQRKETYSNNKFQEIFDEILLNYKKNIKKQQNSEQKLPQLYKTYTANKQYKQNSIEGQYNHLKIKLFYFAKMIDDHRCKYLAIIQKQNEKVSEVQKIELYLKQTCELLQKYQNLKEETNKMKQYKLNLQSIVNRVNQILSINTSNIQKQSSQCSFDNMINDLDFSVQYLICEYKNTQMNPNNLLISKRMQSVSSRNSNHNENNDQLKVKQQMQSQYEQIIKQLKQQHQKTTEGYEQTIRQLKEEIYTLDEVKHQYQNKFKKLHLESSIHLNQKQPVDQQERQLNQEIVKYKKNQENYNNHLKELKSKLSNMKKRNEQKEEQIQRWRRQVDELTSQLIEANNTICKLNDLIEEISKSKSSLPSSNSCIIVSNKKHQSQCSRQYQMDLTSSKQLLIRKSLQIESQDVNNELIGLQSIVKKDQQLQTSIIYQMEPIDLERENEQNKQKIEFMQMTQLKGQIAKLQKQIQDLKNSTISDKSLIEIQKQTILNLQREIGDFKQKLTNQQLINSKFKEEIQKAQSYCKDLSVNGSQLHFFTGKIFQHFNNEEKSYLINQLKSRIGDFQRTHLVYRYDPLNKVNFHRYIDGHNHVVLIMKTILGRMIASYSQKAFHPKNIEKGDGILMSLTEKRSFYIKDKKAILYDDYYLIFGNSQIRIKTQENKLFSNFGINNCYYQNAGAKVQVLLGDGANREVQLIQYEVYSLEFLE